MLVSARRRGANGLDDCQQRKDAAKDLDFVVAAIVGRITGEHERSQDNSLVSFLSICLLVISLKCIL